MLNIIHNLCRFANPIIYIYGDYPHSMKYLVGNSLPKFTAAQSKSLKGSLDTYTYIYIYTYTQRIIFYLFLIIIINFEYFKFFDSIAVKEYVLQPN